MGDRPRGDEACKQGSLLQHTFGISGEPPLLDASGLLLQLADAPKQGKAHDSQDGGEQGMLHEQGGGAEGEATRQENRPYPVGKVILALDDDGMKDADDDEGEIGRAHV